MDLVRPVEDRDALYYPYIHIRDEAWLRSTLLFFPHVLRMAPDNYRLKDSRFVKELASTRGRRGEPLVGYYPVNSSDAHAAGARLARRFEPDLGREAFRARFSREATRAEFGNDNIFQIHRSKFADALLAILERGELIWTPKSRLGRGKRPQWLSVHPRVGEVIMSTAAATAARACGCDVVTTSRRNHIVTATRDEDVIYSALLPVGAGMLPERRPTEWEIGNLVVATTLDLSALSAADFAALHQDGEALFDFRSLLHRHASRIPATGDDHARMRRAEEAAEAIVDQWEKQRARPGKFFKRLFRIEAAEEAKGAATDLLGQALVGAGAAGGAAIVTGTLLAAAPGLAVGLLFYGIKTKRGLVAEEGAAPTRFLSRIVERGGLLAAASAPARRD